MIDKNSIKKEEKVIEPKERKETKSEKFRESVSLKGNKMNKFLTSKELYEKKQKSKRKMEEETR